jgi:tetratricopeptide (TPR) repeat protein
VINLSSTVKSPLEVLQMKYFVLPLALLLASSTAVYSQNHSTQMHKASDERSASLMTGLGSHHHTVSTDNAEAQRFFDQGLTLIYAFNHEEAIRSFKRAAELDPQLAMAHWGIALALGPNINLDVDPAREKAAYEAAQQALSLAAKAPENERAYIEALVKRYSIDPKADLKKLAVDYKNAMGEMVKRYPDDLDAATLYAESMMNLRPWQLWSKDGKPAEDTEEIIMVLESVLRRNPNHIGAIHYYIHTVEASPNPGRALGYISKLASLVPAAGHLVHMPAHIYVRTGDYEAAARSNKEAAEADQAYIRMSGARGIYPLMYYNHNLHFLAYAHSMAGQFAEAMKAARQLESNVGPHVKQMPMLEGFMPTLTQVLVRFRRWDDILTSSEPDRAMPVTNALWHYARGMAYAATGKIESAEAEQKVFMAAAKTIAVETPFGLNNTGSILLPIAGNVLSARIALARNDKKSAIELLRKAVVAEDALNYDEPPGWVSPVRESLGGALLLDGNYAEAEAVFRADLLKNPRNGRSLLGLMESLKAQGKKHAAQSVQMEFESAWKNADVQLRVEDL